MPIGDLLAQITGEPSPTGLSQSVNIPLAKRKADEQMRRPADKIQKTGPSAVSSSQPLNPSAKYTARSSSAGSSRPSQSGQNGHKSSITCSTNTTFQNGQPTPPPIAEPAKAPKKGSYAEILQRAKLGQATLGQVGKIQHKRIERPPNKRERKDMAAGKAQRLQKNLAPDSKFQRRSQALLRDGRNGAKDNKTKGTESVPEKKPKKAATATTGYTGTARPRPGGSNGAKSASASSSRYDRGPDRYRREERGGASKARYAYISEEEDDVEDEHDYYSDASSDMEAAEHEIDEEEEIAAREARREDAAALAEENRLKREKEEKKRRLMAMAKKRR